MELKWTAERIVAALAAADSPSKVGAISRKVMDAGMMGQDIGMTVGRFLALAETRKAELRSGNTRTTTAAEARVTRINRYLNNPQIRRTR